MASRMTRRELFGAGGIAGVSLLGGGALASAISSASLARTVEFPWPYKKLEPAEVAERAYRDYWQAGCMFAGFDGIVGLMAEKFGEPYSSFPKAMMSYGGGGVAGWGTVCGALNGAAAAMALFATGRERTAIIDDIFHYYVQAELPSFAPEKTENSVNMVPAKAGSPLCHVSIPNSGYELGSIELRERCGRLAAEISSRAGANLNALLDGKFESTLSAMPETVYCLECHGSGGKGPRQVGKMNCVGCHEDHTKAGTK